MCPFPPVPARTVCGLSDVPGQMRQLSQVWIGRLCPFPGITLPTQAPSFQINHRTVLSNAGASRGHLTVTPVGQGTTLRHSRSHQTSLHCHLPAGNESKPLSSQMNLPDEDQLQHERNFPSQLPLQQKKTTQGPNEVKCADTVHRSLENIKVR